MKINFYLKLEVIDHIINDLDSRCLALFKEVSFGHLLDIMIEVPLQLLTQLIRRQYVSTNNQCSSLIPI